MRKLVYYVATSIDGFISDPSGGTGAFSTDPEILADLFARYPETCPAHVREALGVTAAPRRFDTVLLGRRTHEPAVEAGLAAGAYPHLRQIVVTHREIPGATSIEVLHGDVVARVEALKRERGRDIWLCGGGDLAGQLIDVIDELQLKINPFVFGDGIGLFGRIARVREFQPVGTASLPGGVTLATFETTAK